MEKVNPTPMDERLFAVFGKISDPDVVTLARHLHMNRSGQFEMTKQYLQAGVEQRSIHPAVIEAIHDVQVLTEFIALREKEKEAIKLAVAIITSLKIEGR